MMAKRRITDRLGRVYEVDDETGVTTPVPGEGLPAQAPAIAPSAQSSRFPGGSAPLFGETLMPREAPQQRAPGRQEEPTGISNLERLGAVLTALGNPSAALALLGQAEKRAQGRATAASRAATGGGLARAQELEAAGDPQGALAALAQALRGAQEPALVTQILKSSEALQKRTRGSKAAKALTKELVETDPVFRDGALATVLAFKYVEAFPDAAPQVGQIIKGLRDEVKWEKVGSEYIGTVPTNPKLKPFKVTFPELHNVAGTLMQTRGGELVKTMIPPKDITLEPGKTPTRIPGETILAPGQQAPGVAPAGAIVPAQGFVPPGQAPAAGPRTLATPPPALPKETALTPEQRQLLAGTPFANVRTFEELDKVGGGPALKGIIDAGKKADLAQRESEWNRRLQEMNEAMDIRTEARLRLTAEEKNRRPAEDIGLWHNTTTFAPGVEGMSPNELREQGFRKLSPKQSETFGAVTGLKGMLDRAWQVVKKHPEWFPRATGDVTVDQPMAKIAASRRKAESQTEDAAFLAAIEGRGAQFVRAAGDTRISNIDIERQLKQLGVGNPEVTTGILGIPTGLSNAYTMDAVAGKFNFLVDTLNDQFKIMGFGQIPRYDLPPVTPGSPAPGGGRLKRPGRW